jgi:hypothetical protein
MRFSSYKLHTECGDKWVFKSQIKCTVCMSGYIENEKHFISISRFVECICRNNSLLTLVTSNSYNCKMQTENQYNKA